MTRPAKDPAPRAALVSYLASGPMTTRPHFGQAFFPHFSIQISCPLGHFTLILGTGATLLASADLGDRANVSDQ
jgi:hypothetical protein